MLRSNQRLRLWGASANEPVIVEVPLKKHEINLMAWKNNGCQRNTCSNLQLQSHISQDWRYSMYSWTIFVAVVAMRLATSSCNPSYSSRATASRMLFCARFVTSICNPAQHGRAIGSIPFRTRSRLRAHSLLPRPLSLLAFFRDIELSAQSRVYFADCTWWCGWQDDVVDMGVWRLTITVARTFAK